jgi:hypothetical protein
MIAPRCVATLVRSMRYRGSVGACPWIAALIKFVCGSNWLDQAKFFLS